MSGEEPIDVLHVDDDSGFLEVTTTFLTDEDDRFAIDTVTSATDALEYLADHAVDCIISDYDMPGMNGLEFLEAVRETHPDLPFILFTGKGSEAVASDAIARGATDYLQKTTGTEQYELLANRLCNAVEQSRARAERQQVYQALETATQGIGILDDEECYTYLNEAYAAQYGYEPDEIVGRNWELLYPDGEVERFHEQILPVLREQGHWQGRSRGLHVDGTTFPEQLSLTELDSGGHVCAVQDITERVERELELERYEAFVTESSDLISVMSPDGMCTYVSPAARDIFGHDPEDMVGPDAGDFLHPEDRANVQAVIDQVMTTPEESAVVEFRYERGDGSWAWVEATVVNRLSDPAIDGILFVSRDVTDRKEREQRLLRQNEQFDVLASIVSHDLQTPVGAARGHLELAMETGERRHMEQAMESLERIDELRQDFADVLQARALVDAPERVDVASVATTAWTTSDHPDDTSLEVFEPHCIMADADALQCLFENLFRNAIEHGEAGEVRVGRTADGIYVADDGSGIAPEQREEVFTLGVSTAPDGSGVGLASVQQIVAAHDWGITVTESETGGARFEISGIESANQ